MHLIGFLRLFGWFCNEAENILDVLSKQKFTFSNFLLLFQFNKKYRPTTLRVETRRVHPSFINFFRIDKLNSIPLCEVMFKWKFTWTCAWLAWAHSLIKNRNREQHWTTLEEMKGKKKKRERMMLSMFVRCFRSNCSRLTNSTKKKVNEAILN